MASEKKYSLWPAGIIVVLAFGAPLWIGTIEIRIARNAMVESSLVQYLDAVGKAEATYRKNHPGYASSIEELPGLPEANKYYTFDYRLAAPDSYSLTASPKEPGKHGKRYFYLDQSGVIRAELLHPATESSLPLPSRN